jgi:hypothetical protein
MTDFGMGNEMESRRECIVLSRRDGGRYACGFAIEWMWLDECNVSGI